MPGLEVVDRYTLRIRLKQPDYTFAYILAMPATAAVAREVVQAYGNDLGAHPVGTGPYLLKEYQRSNHIVLEANPGFRKVVFDEPMPANPADAAVARALRGKTLPLIGRIEISVIEEGQPRWLAFLKGDLDYLQPFPLDFVAELLDDGKLKPALAAKGIRHELLLRPNTWWAYFNMQDPVVGGYTPDKIALRRAIGMGFNTDEFIRVLFYGRAIPAQGPIPPDIAGYDPTQRTQAQVYDPAAARALLDQFGYKDRDGDGYRELPDGKPLVIEQLVDADLEGTPARRAVEEEHGRDRHPHGVQEGPASRSCARWRAPASCRCARTAGTPITRTRKTSCSCSTVRTSGRPTIRASVCPNSTASTNRRARSPTHQSAPASSTA